MGAVASIIFKTEMDKSGLIKDLNNAKKDIEKNNKEIAKNEQAKLPFAKQLDELTPKLDAAKQKLHSLRIEQEGIAKAMLPGADPQTFIESSAKKKTVEADIKAQEKEVAKLQKTWDGVSSKVDDYDGKIKAATDELEANKARVGTLEAQMSKGGKNMALAMNKVEKSAHAFQKRILSLGKRILIFSVAATAFRSIKNYMSQLLSTNKEYAAQLAQLKGALMTAFQPIYEFAVPGLIWVLRLLTQIVQIAAALISALFGTSAKQSAENAEALNKEAAAIKGVGGAAKKAQKDLAGFDQINRLTSKDSGGGGGGAGGAAPDFSAFEGMDDDIDRLRKIAKLVLAIGAGLAAWKIASAFGASLSVIAGVAMAAAGAVLYLFGWFDALENGIDWDNLTGMASGLMLAISGVLFAFGPMAGGITAIIGGIGLMIVAWKEWIETGELSTEAFMALAAGALAVGLGLSLLTGNFIPLLIIGIGVLIAAIIKFGGQAKGALKKLHDWIDGVFKVDWVQWFGPTFGKPLETFAGIVKSQIDAIFRILEGLIDFIQGVFTGNWEQAWTGVKNIFGGIFQALVGLVKAPFNAIIGLMNGLLELIFAGLNKIGGAIGSLPGLSFTPWSTPQIPYLARGAVLPPNRPFMAMVGDQTSGTNIEAPLDTIKQAVAEVLAVNGGGNGEVIRLLAIIADRCGVYIDGEELAKTVSKYQREVERAGGY